MAQQLPVVEVRFLALDVDKLKNAFKTVEDMIAGLETKAKRMGSVQEKVVKTVEKAFENTGKAAESAANKIVSNTEKQAQAGAKAVEKAEKEKQKAFEKTNKAQEKLNNNIIKMVRKAGDEEAKAIKKASDEREKADKKAADGLKSSRKAMRNDFLGRTAGAVSGAVGMAARVGGAALALGGGFSAVDSLRYNNDNTLTATRIANASKDDNGNRRVTASDLMKQTGDLAGSTGKTQSELLTGMGKIQALTGSKGTEFAKESVEGLAKLSTAQGADFEKLATLHAGFAVENKQNKGESIQDYNKRIMAITRSAVGSGLEGGIELEGIASRGGKLMGKASSFSGDVDKNRDTLLSLAQHAFSVTKNDDTAFESANALTTAIGGHANKLKAMGATVLDKNGRMINAEDALVETAAVVGDDQNKMHKAGISGVATAAYVPLAALGREAEAKAKADEAAKAKLENRKAKTFSEKELIDIRRQGIKAGIGKYTKQTDQKTIDENFSNVMETNAKKIDKAMETLRISVGEKLVPAFTLLIPKLEKLIPVIGTVVEKMVGFANFISENPINSALVIAGATITKTAAEAIGGAFIRTAMTDGMGAAFKVAGTAGGALFAVAALAAWTEYLYAGVQSGKKTETKEEDDRRNAEFRTEDIKGRLAAGKSVTQEEVNQLKDDTLKLHSLNTESAADAANRARREGGGVGGALWVASKHKAATPEELKAEQEAKAVLDKAQDKLAKDLADPNSEASKAAVVAMNKLAGKIEENTAAQKNNNPSTNTNGLPPHIPNGGGN